MILAVGERTDVVQYYTPWLINRLKEGYVDVRNPFYPKRVNRYLINPDTIDCMLFCSKGYQPILPYLEQIMQRYPVYCMYTITPYGKDIEPGVPSVSDSIHTLQKLSHIVGKQRLTWYYNPVLVYGPYTVEFHMRRFAEMAHEIAPYVHRVKFSFVDMYQKLQYTFRDLKPVSIEDQERILESFGKTCAAEHLWVQTCCEKRDLSIYGIDRGGCVTLDIINQANHIHLKGIPDGHQRTFCGCAERRAIGAYNSCINGCKYCYATTNFKKAAMNYKYNHDPHSSMLIGHLQPDDELIEAKQSVHFTKAEQTALPL